MSSLILVVLLAGAVLYLTGGLVYLYRYTQLRRSRPSQPRVWEDLRHRFTWLSVVGVVLLAGFVFVAWWSVPGHNIPWVPNPFDSGHITTAPRGGGMPWERPMVTGTVPMAAMTASTSDTTATTATETTATMASETTSTVETTTSASTSTTSTTSTSETTTTEAAQAAPPAPAPGSWTVCAASFRKAAMARDYAGRLLKEGLPARVNQVDLGQRGVWHRVCVGAFPSLEQARRQYKNWEKQGLVSDAFLLPLR
ncbi:MAG: SPOR domain-containing protein [Desulfarculaceae bacterium]|nr:SPOR domain-containing protein [Desulfarculaceae bacterium]MCF8074399.1 SPOR domain-containing protein [Desulfarculaceae bacterium]MCF8103625.1 SPOR domain-containing protein [Desulfarculaceae bacterium]MCF8116038.1 SPOR domain-containing protein [Desulfarculaceae bacterium]